MRLLAIALVSVTSSAAGGDFRLANFGDSCSSIRKLEATLGSTEVPVSGIPDYYEFRDKVFEREVRVIYNCEDGRLWAGHYAFPPEEKAQAAETFKVAYEGLVAMYGLPLYDNTPWQVGTLAIDNGHGIQTDPTAYYTSWTTGRALTVLSTVSDATHHNWQVEVGVTPPPAY